MLRYSVEISILDHPKSGHYKKKSVISVLKTLLVVNYFYSFFFFLAYFILSFKPPFKVFGLRGKVKYIEN